MGHGYVVPVNTTFYNNLTEAELFAQLVQIANETFSPAVEAFRSKHSLKMSQAQFDALTSFVFNLGPGTLNESANWTSAVIVNAVDPTPIKSKGSVTGTLNAGDANIFSDTSLDSSVLEGALKDIQRADMLIIGGTSLAVYPAASLVRYYRGSRLVLINKSPTPYDAHANLVIAGPIGEILGAVKA